MSPALKAETRVALSECHDSWPFTSEWSLPGTAHSAPLALPRQFDTPTASPAATSQTNHLRICWPGRGARSTDFTGSRALIHHLQDTLSTSSTKTHIGSRSRFSLRKYSCCQSVHPPRLAHADPQVASARELNTDQMPVAIHCRYYQQGLRSPGEIFLEYETAQ